MRVAIVHNLPSGGARRRLAGQLPHLDAEVIEICLQTATPVTERPIVIPLRLRATTVSRGMRPPLRYVDLLALERAWRRAAATIRRAAPDAVYLNPCRYLQAPPLAGVIGAPSVYFCDEPRRVDSETTAAASRNPRTRPLYAPLYARERRLDRASVAAVGVVATNSRYTAAEIARVYHRDATVVRMGVASELLAGARVTPRESFVLSVGTLMASKGHDLAIEALARSGAPQALVIVAPRDDPAQQRRLNALATRLGVDVSIQIAISDHALADLYSRARATLYLARREPLGLVSLEAQACGCPVIVADEGGLPETVRDGISGWTVARTPAAVAAKLDCLGDGDRRARMSAAAREHGASWTWPRSGRQIRALLEAAMSA